MLETLGAKLGEAEKAILHKGVTRVTYQCIQSKAHSGKPHFFAFLTLFKTWQIINSQDLCDECDCVLLRDKSPFLPFLTSPPCCPCVPPESDVFRVCGGESTAQRGWMQNVGYPQVSAMGIGHLHYHCICVHCTAIPAHRRQLAFGL